MVFNKLNGLAIWGILKLSKRNGGKIDMTVSRKILLSWKIGAKAIVKNHGCQIDKIRRNILTWNLTNVIFSDGT